MPAPFMTLILVIAIVAVLIWLINKIPFPSDLTIIKFILILIVVVGALMKIWPMLAKA